MIGLSLSLALSHRRVSGAAPPPASTAGQPIGLLLILTKAS